MLTISDSGRIAERYSAGDRRSAHPERSAGLGRSDAQLRQVAATARRPRHLSGQGVQFSGATDRLEMHHLSRASVSTNI